MHAVAYSVISLFMGSSRLLCFMLKLNKGILLPHFTKVCLVGQKL